MDKEIIQDACLYIMEHKGYDRHVKNKTLGTLIFNCLIDLYPDKLPFRDELRPLVFKEFNLEYNKNITDTKLNRNRK